MRKPGLPERVRAMADGNRTAALLECAYLLFLAIVTGMAFAWTTMDRKLVTGWPDWLTDGIRVAMMAVVICRLALEENWKPREMLFAAAFGAAFVWNWRRIGERYTLELALLVIGARGIRFERILKVWLAAALAAMLAMLVKVSAGRIANLVYEMEGRRPRYSFGAIYPTDFCAHLFFQAAAWAWLRGKRITAPEIGGIALLALFCLIFCDAHNATACLLTLAVGLLAAKAFRRRETNGRPPKWEDRFLRLLVIAMPLMAAVMILLSRFYDPEIGWMRALNRISTSRLALGRRGFREYGITLFGQAVRMVGNGGSVAPKTNYFWLDSSYVNALLRQGIVPLLLGMSVFVSSAGRQRRAGARERLWILAVVALHCVFEHHLFQIAYDPFLLLALAGGSGDADPGTDAKEDAGRCARKN